MLECHRYSVETKGGGKFLRQHRVDYEGFARPSDTAQASPRWLVYSRHTLTPAAAGLRVKPLRPWPVPDLPGNVSEGGPRPTGAEDYAPGDPEMDRTLACLHEWARSGAIDHAAAEARIHS